MANKKIEVSNKSLDEFYRNKLPKLFVDYFCIPENGTESPKECIDGVLPDDAYRVRIRQTFPVFSPSQEKMIQEVVSEHNLYVGGDLCIAGFLEHEEILRDDCLERLDELENDGFNHAIVVKCNPEYCDGAPVRIFPHGTNDFVFSDITEVREKVLEIAFWQETFVRKPITVVIKTYKKEY